MDDNKAILITGASSGIGKSCAQNLDKRGFKVYAGVRKKEDGERLPKRFLDWLMIKRIQKAGK